MRCEGSRKSIALYRCTKTFFDEAIASQNVWTATEVKQRRLDSTECTPMAAPDGKEGGKRGDGAGRGQQSDRGGQVQELYGSAKSFSAGR